MNVFRIAAAVALTAGLFLPAKAQVQVQKEWTELRGMRSAIDQPHQEIVQDAGAWKALWARHARGTGQEATPPAVDFSKESVAAVFLGLRPKPESIDFVVEKGADGEVVVYYKDKRNAHSFGPTVIAYPFAFRKLPKAPTRLEPAKAGAGSASFVLGQAEAPRETGVRDAVAQVSGKLKSVFAARGTGNVAFDGSSALGTASGGAVKAELMQLPPPPVQQDPQQGQDGGRRGQGNLPPPPRQDRGGRGNLPPPPEQGNGNLPPPPQYRPRPSDPGRLPPPPGDQIGYEDSGVTTTGHWRLYRDQVFGNTVVRYGSWQNETATSVIERGGSETDVRQGTRYTAQLDSRAFRNEYALYYRYVGTDCDPNDPDNCLRWERQFRYFYEDRDWGRNRHMSVVVEFERDQPLIPWEKERIDIHFDGSRVWIAYPNAAFGYSERGPIIDQQAGTATVILTPGARNLRAPEKNKVQAYLKLEGGALKLVVADARAQHYAGERLEIQVVVKWDKPWSVFNPTVFERGANGPIVITIDPSKAQNVYDVPASSKGEYWIDSWSFRRAGSKISRADWMYQGGGNKVVK